MTVSLKKREAACTSAAIPSHQELVGSKSCDEPSAISLLWHVFFLQMGQVGRSLPRICFLAAEASLPDM